MMKPTCLVFPKRTRTLAQLLTSCGQVANTLNWNHKSSSSTARLLAVRLNGRNHVDLALIAHPSCRQSSSSSFRASSASGWDGGSSLQNVTVPLEQGKKYLQDLLHNNTTNNNNTKRNNNGSNNVNIQGLIIGWPRQPDGWLGYQCGRVFYHLLDAVETTARPAVCLFDDHHHGAIATTATTTVLADDAWGRNPVYSRVTAAAMERQPHVASREQYYATTTTASTTTLRGGAVDLAEQFCRAHWPEYYQQQQEEEEEQEPFLSNNSNLDMWAATSSFHGSLLPRSAPMMNNMMQQQQHSWMASGDHHHQAAGGMRHRSLASA